MAPIGIVSAIKEAPITSECPPPSMAGINQPSMPRATRAISREKPEGDDRSPNNKTVLQQHMAFWDRNDKGVIWPWDTYVGFRRLGFNYLISLAAVPVLHMTFSYPTMKGWLPHPLFPIYLERAHRTKHGSDSEVFDTAGRFVPDKFEAIFSQHDKEGKGGLNWADVQALVYHNMNCNDPNGWVAGRLEWWVTYLLLRDEKGLLSKEKIRGMYDGTIWEEVAKDVERKKHKRTLV